MQSRLMHIIICYLLTLNGPSKNGFPPEISATNGRAGLGLLHSTLQRSRDAPPVREQHLNLLIEVGAIADGVGYVTLIGAAPLIAAGSELVGGQGA